MNAPSQSDPRLEQAAVTDESLLAAHEKVLGRRPDDQGHYRLLPLNLLFVFAGLIFFSGTYLNLYSGHFNPAIYNEHAKPHTGAAEAVAVDPVALGKKIFTGTCQTCHQITGLGLPGAIPPLAGSEWVMGPEERVIRAVMYGVQGAIKVKGADFSSAMPPNGKVPGSGFNLSDDKIAAVLTYVRQEWGNTGGPITTEQVAAIHAKEGEHKQWTSEELLKIQ